MKTKSRNLIVVFLMALAMLLACIPVATLTANAELASLENVNVNNGVVTWDAFPGAAGYSYSYGPAGGSLDEPSLDLELKAKSFHFETGNYNYSIYAVDEYGAQISGKKTGTYSYTCTQTPLATPTNLTWDHTTARWDAVEDAEYYILYIYEYKNGDYSLITAQGRYVYDTSCDMGSRFEVGKTYCFDVKACAAYGDLDHLDSEYGRSGNKTFEGVVPSLTNVQVENGKLTFDAVPGASKYDISIGTGGSTCNALPINMYEICSSISLNDGVYDIKIRVYNEYNEPLAPEYTYEDWGYDSALAPAKLTGTLTVTGTLKVGETLTATLTDSNNTGTLTYTWLRSDPYVSWVVVQKSDSNTFVLTEACANKRMSVIVESDVEHSQVESANTGIVAEANKAENLTGTVNILGTKKYGGTLTANVSSNNTGTLYYQWKRSGVDIPGATSISYVITVDDIGKILRVEVTSSVEVGNIASDATAVIEKANGDSAPTGITATGCTNKANNDGTISGVTTAMEYKLGDGSWNNVTSTTINNLASGTYYIRIKETDTHKASETASVVVNAYVALTYDVTFDANGGTGEMASVPVVENDTYELPACGFTAPTGYEFKCWSVNEVEKAVGDEITITADTTVKAVWKASNNIDAGSVSVNNKAFSATRLYYKNGADGVTNDSENYNAHFNPDTNILTLKNYEGDAIAIGGAIQEDVTIVLIGTNIITTNDQKAISSTNGGGIFITAESEASLTINCTAGQSTIYGIYTGSWGNGVLDISGYADVTINVNSTRNDSSVYGVYIDGTIDIKDNAKLTINTSSANTLSGYSVGMGMYAKQGITFNTTKKILVNTSGIPSENGNYGIYSDIKVDLKKAEELKIVVSAGSYATPVYPAANTQNWTGFQASTNVEAKVLTTTYTPKVMQTVTFNSNGGSGSMDPVESAGEYTLPSCTFTAPTGKQFKGWATSANGEVIGATYNVTADVEFFAIWEEIPVVKYTVSFNANGGTGEMASVPVVENDTYELPACGFTAPTGYEFKCWSVNEVEKAVGDEITITADTTVKAVWKAKSYTITFDTNGGSAINPITQDYGTEIAAPANPTKSGYIFTGWDKAIPSTMPAENMTITAQWTEVIPNTYTVTYTDGVDNVELFADQVNANITEGTATPAFNGTPTREGYTFAGWSPSVAGTVTANVTYTATWTINQYTITFDTDGGSAVAPITQDYGTAIVAPANPTKSGYTFTGWDKTIPSTMPAENMTITAQWTEVIPNTYTVTYTDGVDNVELFADQVNANITEGTATPAFNGTPTREGYTFAGWSPSVAGTVTANVTYTATWELIPVHTHDYGTAWQSDENNHWNECACGDKANVAPHADKNNDGKCDTCDYAMDNAENPGENIESEKTGLSGGAIAGIAVGSVAVAGLGGFSLFWFVIKKKKFADLIALFKKK